VTLGVTAIVVVFLVGAQIGAVLIASALAAVSTLIVGMISGRRRGRRLTIYLAHLGMAVLLSGVAGSSFGADFNGTMVPGDTVEVAGHQLTLDEIETGDRDRYAFVRADFELDGAPISPEIRGYEEQATPVAEPALRSSPLDDVVVAISLLFPDGDTVEVSVFVRPLVTWVWVGAALMGVAGLAALFGRDGAASRRRRSAKGEQPAGETTSGTVAR
jgi:cytochrome c-type biogenesis protein CcmF